MAAFEILIATPAIKNLIREGKVYQIQGIMSMGIKEGMQTLDQGLANLVKKQVVARDEAFLRANDHEQFLRLLKE